MSDEETTPESSEEMIPKSVLLKRINSKNTHIEKIEAEKAALADQLTAASAWESKAESADTLREQFEKLTAEFDGFKQSAGIQNTLQQAGILDGEDQDLVKYRYSKLEEENRPTLVDWLNSGAREDRYVSGLFRQPEQASQQPAVIRPNGNNGAAQPPQAGSALSMESIQQMSAEERKKPENHKAIMKYLGFPS